MLTNNKVNQVIFTSSEAEAVVSNEDLLIEILLRVPTKSIMRFKCVSKHWLSITSDPRFCINHSALLASNSSISGVYFYFHSKMLPEPLKSLSFRKDSSDPPKLDFLDMTSHIEHSCNGLLLCRREIDIRYLVCNPITRKKEVLPFCSLRYGQNLGAFLSFDPSKSQCFKVIQIWHDYTNLYTFSIYSSETKSWKHLDLTINVPYYIPKALWNGAIHWVAYKNCHVRFEIDQEELIMNKLHPFPIILNVARILYFGESFGRLFLIQRRSKYYCGGFSVLEMENKHFHWVFKYYVNLNTMVSLFPDMSHNFYLLSVVKGANEDEFAVVIAIREKILSYNMKCKTVEVLCDFPTGEFHRARPYSRAHKYLFMPSLFPL